MLDISPSTAASVQAGDAGSSPAPPGLTAMVLDIVNARLDELTADIGRVPPWLPRGVVHVVTSLWPTLRPANKAHVLRIACDPDIHGVWKELREGVKEYPPNARKVSARWAKWQPGLGKMPDPPMSTSELAFGLFFYAACLLSSSFDFDRNVGHMIRTRAEYDRMVERERKRAAGLREDSQFFRRLAALPPAILGDFDLERCAQELDRGADFIGKMLVKRSGRLPIVAYDRGDRRVRAYVLHLTRQAEDLFTRENRRTVATVTNVALRLEGAHKISGEQVYSITRGQKKRAAKLANIKK